MGLYWLEAMPRGFRYLTVGIQHVAGLAISVTRRVLYRARRCTASLDLFLIHRSLRCLA
jgi:hypothetical protein